MQNYSNEEQNIIDENREFSLSLRKRKINFKLFEGRNISGFNNKKISSIFDEKNDISIIKSKFNDLHFELDIDEEILLDNLSELLGILESFIIHKKKIFITEELIEQSIIDKIYKNILFNKYNNQEEILTKILTLLSEVIFLYNKIPNLSIYKTKFISNNEYINLFFSLLNSDSDEIIYKTYKFIGLLADNSEEISMKLYNDKILEQIINNHKFNDIGEIISVKVWLIGNFNLDMKYASDLELYLNIQKFYISVFKEFIFNKDYEKELLDNLIKILINLSLCKNDIYLKNLLDSKIISFILNLDKANKYISANNLLIIIGNMSSTDNSEILLNLYNESIHYLINIISCDNIKDCVLNLALGNINNFIEDNNLCIDIFLKKDFMSIYQKYILKNITIDENIFNEICLSFQNLILCINNRNKDFYLLKKYNIISLIVDGFKKIVEIKNLNKTGMKVIEVLFLLFIINDKDIANFNKITFENKGGYEFIFNEIRNLFYEEKIKNFIENNNVSTNNDENGLLKFIDLIEERF